MAGLINELIEILNKQALAYEELLILSTEKKSVIINNDIDALQKITIVENKIVSRSQKLEEKRLELMKDISSVLNRKNEELTLSLLEALMEGQDEAPLISEVRTKLKDTVTKLKEANDLNTQLIEGSLEYIEFTMNLVRSNLDEGPSYYNQGKKIIDGEKGFFDAKQ